MSGGRAWTTFEARRFHELRSQSVPMAEIAKMLGRSTDALYSFLRYVPATRDQPAYMKRIDRVGRPPIRRTKPSPYWTSPQVQTLRLMIEDGASVRQISEKLGRTQKAVICKASDLGLKFGHRGRGSAYRDKEILRFQRNAVEGSTMLLEALLKLAA